MDRVIPINPLQRKFEKQKKPQIETMSQEVQKQKEIKPETKTKAKTKSQKKKIALIPGQSTLTFL